MKTVKVVAAVICDSLQEKNKIFATAFHLSMDCFWCEVVHGEVKLLEAEDARWLSKDALYSVMWLPADRTLIEEIEKQMR